MASKTKSKVSLALIPLCGPHSSPNTSTRLTLHNYAVWSGSQWPYKYNVYYFLNHRGPQHTGLWAIWARMHDVFLLVSSSIISYIIIRLESNLYKSSNIGFGILLVSPADCVWFTIYKPFSFNDTRVFLVNEGQALHCYFLTKVLVKSSSSSASLHWATSMQFEFARMPNFSPLQTPTN